MLYSIDSGSHIDSIPHREDYDRWRRKMSDHDYNGIMAALNEMIEGSEIQTSSWMPGNDWTDTVFEPIYTKACDYDETASAKFFGLLVWEVMLKHEATWAFGRYQLNGIPIEGLTYFQVTL